MVKWNEKINSIILIFIFAVVIVLFNYNSDVYADSNLMLDGKEFILNKDAFYNEEDNTVTLTKEQDWQNGSLVLKDRVSFNSDFEIELELNLGNRGTGGADGVGVVFHSSDSSKVGNAGKGLGITGLANAYGIAFDTFHNDGDPATPYVGIWETDANGSRKAIKNPVKFGGSIVDGKFRKVNIYYDSESSIATVSYEGRSWEVEINKDLYGEVGGAFAITGSTGNWVNLQQVKVNRADFILSDEGKVVVSYLDELGFELHDDINLVGKIDEDYTTEEKVFDGYVLKEINGNKTGKYSKNDNHVTYVYIKAEYFIEYNVNGGIGEQKDLNNPYYKHDKVKVLDNNNIKRNGYKFIGWNTNADGSGDDFKPEDTLVIDSNITLYAQWEKIKENVDKDKPTDYSSIIWDWGHTTTPEVKTELHRAYINGYPDGSVKPQGEITRGEVAAIMSRLHADLEEIEYSTETKYSDVKATDWYAKHIAYVSDKGLMEGYEDGSFKPEDKITRAEYATVVARFKNLERIATSFEDSKDHWASEFIGAVANKKWITGYPDGSFKPANNITREEVVTMTNKMLDRKVDEQGIGDLNIKKFTDLQYGTWSYYELVEATNNHEYVRREAGSIVEDWKSIID